MAIDVHDLVFYVMLYVAILIGAILVHKFVYNRRRVYDIGSLYLSVLGATYIWIFAISIREFGMETGFIVGVIGGAIAVALLDAATGFLHRAGY